MQRRQSSSAQECAPDAAFRTAARAAPGMQVMYHVRRPPVDDMPSTRPPPCSISASAVVVCRADPRAVTAWRWGFSGSRSSRSSWPPPTRGRSDASRDAGRPRLLRAAGSTVRPAGTVRRGRVRLPQGPQVPTRPRRVAAPHPLRPSARPPPGRRVLRGCADRQVLPRRDRPSVGAGRRWRAGTAGGRGRGAGRFNPAVSAAHLRKPGSPTRPGSPPLRIVLACDVQPVHP